MKVLVIINSIDVSNGGTSRSSTSVISKLSKQFPDVEITLLTRTSKNPVLNTFENVNARIVFCHRLTTAVFQNFRLFREVDVVHVQGLWSAFPTFIGIFVKLFSKAQLVVSPRGMLEPWSLQQGSFKKKVALITYQGLLFKLTDIFHVTAPEEARSLSAIVPNKSNVVIPNGIDTTSFTEAIHADDSENRTILFLSRIHKKKGVEMLIETWSLLQEDWPNWKVRIIGDGNLAYIESLRQLILSKKIKNIKVDEPVYKEDKRLAYSSSDLFVLPTYSENFGIVIAEALASSVPVITTTGTPWSEIKSNRCGEYIEPSVDEIEVALKKWMTLTPNERKEAGRRGKQLIQRKYSIDSVAASFYELYQHSLKHNA